MFAHHHGAAVTTQSSLICFLLVLITALVPSSVAQFVTVPRNLTVVQSPFHDEITISYKTPTGACDTAFSAQQQYTGWVSVPGEFSTNLFFWFVEAREPTDMLTIWLNGGPGSSSLFGFFNGLGPCEVVEAGMDRYETLTNAWGWDRASNMLFIDQPNQVGFSFDTPTNSSIDLLSSEQITPPEPLPDSRSSSTFRNGTFSSAEASRTPHTTEQAALAVWHLLQGFFSIFPDYHPPGNSSLGVNLFAESYGGKYGPIFADIWRQQNEKRENGTLPHNNTLEVHLTSLGIVNGCIDSDIEAAYYPYFARHNTYGFEAISSVRAKLADDSINADGGCLDLLRECRERQLVHDPDGEGSVGSVNEKCSEANSACSNALHLPYLESGRSEYDIAFDRANPFPPRTWLEYVNTAKFQEAIGAATNHSATSQAVVSAFNETGDFSRGGVINRIASLLDAGVRVGLMYGDRDYICNWLGGEASSLAIAAAAETSDYETRFEEAGYAPIIVNDSYIGGVVRQYANLSFSRVYQAGHELAAYQPETAFQVFARIVLGKSVSTGDEVNLGVSSDDGDDTYASDGDETGDSHSDDLPSAPGSVCYVRHLGSCDLPANKDEAASSLAEGTVINGVWYAEFSDWPLATEVDEDDPSATKEGDLPDATSDHDCDDDCYDEEEDDDDDKDDDDNDGDSPSLTGLFTATATPDDNAGVALGVGNRGTLWALGMCLCATLLFAVDG